MSTSAVPAWNTHWILPFPVQARKLSRHRRLSYPAAPSSHPVEPQVRHTAALDVRRPMVAPAEIENWLRAWIGRRLAVPAHQIDPLQPFADFGVDSVAAVELAEALTERLGTLLPTTIAWDFPNIRALANGALREKAGG